MHAAGQRRGSILIVCAALVLSCCSGSDSETTAGNDENAGPETTPDSITQTDDSLSHPQT